MLCDDMHDVKMQVQCFQGPLRDLNLFKQRKQKIFFEISLNYNFYQ